jgi:hypothetical protein
MNTVCDEGRTGIGRNSDCHRQKQDMMDKVG